MDKIELSLSQQYEMEKIGRAIDSESDIDKLKSTCKALLRAWMIQRSAVSWVMRQKCKAPPITVFKTGDDSPT